MAITEQAPKHSKAELARNLGVSRSSLYYQPKLPAKDLLLQQQIAKVLAEHKAYGHRRVAWELGINPKRARRVMKLFGLKPKRRFKHPIKHQDIGQEPVTIPNLLRDTVIDAPHIAWQSDFTYLPYFGKFIYLATVIDSYTRQILGWALSTRHTTELISEALLYALQKYPPPQLFHSDQGSEYKSQEFLDLLASHTIKPSMSEKASPWQNGRQESLYGKFKLELGHPECYPILGELTEAIARQIYYYNHRRIHTALKCPPTIFYQRYQLAKTITQKLLNPAAPKEQVV
jgi:transposase InsO family protein